MNRPDRQPRDYAGPQIVSIDEIERRLREDADRFAAVRQPPQWLLDKVERDDWRFNERRPRHVVIGEPITASRLVGAFALALVTFVAIYFGGHFLWAALS